MLEDFFGFVADTLVGLWNAVVEAWFFVFGVLY